MLSETTLVVKCPHCPVQGYKNDMSRHVRRHAKVKAAAPERERKRPRAKPPERRWTTDHPDYGEALRARKYRRPERTAHEPADDALLVPALERVLYQPHYAARGLPVRTLSVEGVSPRVLAEFEAWAAEEEEVA